MDPENHKLSPEEELSKKHRQERKDLQAKIQALKKTAPKGKKKKEVLEDIIKLEQELDNRQSAELSSLTDNEENDNAGAVVQSETSENNSESTGNTSAEAESADQIGDVPHKITRAQKRRNKKQEESKEREKRIAEQEEKNKEGPRVVETKKIKELLQCMGLELHNIPADGNCLYCAVNHQLKVTGRLPQTINNLRKLTATFMREHQQDFLPFMYNDSDESFDEAQFLDYCKNVEFTKMWGSQLELKALSNILKCPIKIIQASGQPTIQGENYDGQPLVLTYHRHLYRLGEHYNSTTTVMDNKTSVNT